jgi:lipopolysaccharide/colanic/teichoic acid biosynthesis glycosyltransferase
MQEPRRLFARYVLGNPLFLAHAFLHACPPQRLHAKVSRGAKVAFDRTVGALALALLLPLFLAIAAAIRLEDRGPVFFRQTRIG